MTGRARGRPPQYDCEAALNAAMQTFWQHGYSATSLDDLARAMAMNRPSIYNAFGDKAALYAATLEHFIADLRDEVGRLVLAEPDLERALCNLYLGALAVYFAAEPARGCFVFCTAPVEAIEHPEIRALVGALLAELDDLLARKFRDARQAGAWTADGEPRQAARMAQAVLHSIALRARAGESRATLERFARYSARTLARA
jgi:AcrR family transcriptional regulator